MTRILLGKHQNSLGNPPCQEASPVLSHNNPNPFCQVRQKGYTILFGCFFLSSKKLFCTNDLQSSVAIFCTNDCSTKTSLFHLQCPRVLFLGSLCLCILCGSVLLCVAVPGGQSSAKQQSIWCSSELHIWSYLCHSTTSIACCKPTQAAGSHSALVRFCKGSAQICGRNPALNTWPGWSRDTALTNSSTPHFSHRADW